MAWIERNKPFGKPMKPTRFRRIALGSWGAPSDPTIYGVLEVNAEKALAYIDQWKEKSGERITINHFVGKVWAHVLRQHPELNCELRFGQFYPRQSIDLSFQVAIEGERSPTAKDGFHHHDLSAGFVPNADTKNLAEIAADLNRLARKIRSTNDAEFGGLKKLSAIIPGFLQRFAVWLLQIVLQGFNLWSPALGIPKNAFGSILITNVGSLGIDFALPALFPPAGVPVIVAVGAIYKAPVYETDDQGVITRARLQRHVRLCGAFDHRYIDGLHASRVAREIRHLFDHPELV